MIRAAIVTPWTPAPPDNRPEVADNYQLQSWSDVTGQPAGQIVPAPNQYTIVAEMSDDVFAILAADERYMVLWSEEIVSAEA